MPQVFQVIRCAECQAFQVQLEKKSHKFNCMLCNTKQTLQKVYARSSKASDCREVCQKYNAARIDCEDDAPINHEPPQSELLLPATTNSNNNNNKWASWQDQDTSGDHENDFTIAPIPRNEQQQQQTGRSRKKQKTTTQQVGGGGVQYDDLVAEEEAEKNYTNRSVHPTMSPPPQMKQDTLNHHHHRYNAANTTEEVAKRIGVKEASIVDSPPPLPPQQQMNANRSIYDINEYHHDNEEGAGKWGTFLAVEEDDCF